MLSKRTSLLISVLFIAVLGVSFGLIYFDDHAWGTWGDDSAGYIYLAGRMYTDQPLVYVDDLAAKGIAFFGDEKLARWLTPTHHQFINPTGTIASKYPIGASLLMYSAAKIVGSSEAFYIVTPLLAVLNIILVYILAQQLFPKERWRHTIGLLAGLFLGVSGLYYDYAIAQPMREIPSLFFLLLMSVCTMQAVTGVRGRGRGTERQHALQRGIWFALAGLSFGAAFVIRETSAMVLPGLGLFIVWSMWNRHARIMTNTRKLLPFAAVFLTAIGIALIPLIKNQIAISTEKVPFKSRDTGSVVVLSNIGHVQTLSIENVFDNPGKFRPGKGSLPHYWSVLQKSAPVPFFLVLVAIGLIYMWRDGGAQQRKGVYLFLWSLGTLMIFSLWINPYSRYILPMFPPVMLLGSYGLVMTIQKLIPTIFAQRGIQSLAIVSLVLGMFLSYQPIFADVQDNIAQDVYRFKAISQKDLHTLVDIGTQLKASAEKPVLLFAGDWQYGTSETLEAHTGVKTIRFPLEQRFDFNTEQVYTFFTQMLNDGYSLYVWSDATASPEFFSWLQQYSTNTVGVYDFSFQSGVTLYHIEAHSTDQNTKQ